MISVAVPAMNAGEGLSLILGGVLVVALVWVALTWPRQPSTRGRRARCRVSSRKSTVNLLVHKRLDEEDMGFSVACTPGRDAVAGFMKLTPELPALVLYLDPVNMVIQLPPIPDGAFVLAKFCRELSREASKLADAVDPDGGSTDPAAPATAEGEPAGACLDAGERG